MANEKLKDVLNRADPNTLADIFRQLKLGNLFRAQFSQTLRRKDPAASSYNLATLEVISLPLTAKATAIHRATSIAGTVTGELAPQTFGTTPATGQCAVTPNGDIAVLAADAITSVDVIYVPERGVLFQAEIAVASNVLTIPTPQTAQGVILLMECEATAGTTAGKKIVLVPGAGAPAAGQARLNVAKTTVTFAGADAVTRAKISLLLCCKSDEDLDTQLESTALALS